MKHLYLLALCLLVSTTCWSEEKLKHNLTYSFPGGVAELILDKQSDTLPEIKFGAQEPVIIEQEHTWKVLVGISLDTIPGEYLLYIKRSVDGATSEHLKFFVKQQPYPINKLERNSKKRIHQSHEQFSDLGYNNTQQPNLPLNLPVSGNWNTNFGSIFHHSKKDKLISQNQIFLEVDNIISIKAPENALISNIKTNQDGSKTVFLDHGRGLFSIIGGLTEINVEIGNGVLSGAVIGKVTPDANFKNATVKNRLLTWQCIVNNTYVNPFIFTKI